VCVCVCFCYNALLSVECLLLLTRALCDYY